MTKIKSKNILSNEEFIDGVKNISPYSEVAFKYLDRKGIYEPDLVDVLDAMYTLSKVHDKLNNNMLNFDEVKEYVKKIERS